MQYIHSHVYAMLLRPRGVGGGLKRAKESERGVLAWMTRHCRGARAAYTHLHRQGHTLWHSTRTRVNLYARIALLEILSLSLSLSVSRLGGGYPPAHVRVYVCVQSGFAVYAGARACWQSSAVAARERASGAPAHHSITRVARCEIIYPII